MGREVAGSSPAAAIQGTQCLIHSDGLLKKYRVPGIEGVNRNSLFCTLIQVNFFRTPRKTCALFLTLGRLYDGRVKK